MIILNVVLSKVGNNFILGYITYCCCYIEYFLLISIDDLHAHNTLVVARQFSRFNCTLILLQFYSFVSITFISTIKWF